jgi:KipI family sensor histidine kinase inhibitor
MADDSTMMIENNNDMIEIRAASDCSVILYVDDTKIGLDTANTIIEILTRTLLANKPDWLCEYIPSYTSLLIEFSLYDIDHLGVNAFMRQLISDLSSQISDFVADKPGDSKRVDSEKSSDEKHNVKVALSPSKRIHRIPVCYQLSDAETDLSKIALEKNMSEELVVSSHYENTYRVYATGFMPGFAYLGELPEALSQPRLSKPRLKVPKGAVAIADRQTAIYPDESPGGWHIIGYTPLDLLIKSTDKFGSNNGDIEALLKTGDYVEFYPVTENEYLSWTSS